MANHRNLTSRQRFLSLSTSLAVLIYGRMLFPTTPLITEWDWAYKTANNTLSEANDVSFPYMSNKLTLVSIAAPLVQLLISPIAAVAGLIGVRFGYDLGIIAGLCLALVLNIQLSVSNRFWSVLMGQCIKGVAFVLLISLGNARILAVYPTSEKYHYIVMAIALSTSVFSIIDSMFVGYVIKYLGVSASFEMMIPFGVLLIVAIAMQLRLTEPLTFQDPEYQPLQQPDAQPSTSKYTLFGVVTDHKVIIACGGLFMSCLYRAVLEQTLGLWAYSQFNSDSSTTGLIWGIGGCMVVPANIASARFSNWKSNFLWLYALVHLGFCTVPILYFPFSKSPIVGTIAIAIYFYLASSARYAATMMFPKIAELKYGEIYGTVMAIAEAAVSVSYTIGPLFAVPLINHIGFIYTSICIGVCHLLYCPLFVFMKTNEHLES